MKGRIAGTGDSDAFRALFACNVDIPARYFNAYLDKVETGEKTCQDFMTHFMTRLSAMTMDAGKLLKMAEGLSADGNVDAAVVETLGVAAEDAMTEEGLKDPKRLIKDRLSDRTKQVCPDIAPYILR